MDAASSRLTQPLVQVARWSLASGLAGMLTLAVVLAIRRFAGAQRPLEPAAAIVLALLLAGGAALVRLVWQRLVAVSQSPAANMISLLGPSAVLLLFALAMFTSGDSTAAIAVAWLVILGEESFTLWPTSPTRQGVGSLFRTNRKGSSPRLRSEKDSRPLVQGLPPAATQSQVRSIEADGTHVVTGTLRARLQPGERTAAIHIGFCPPLPSVPQLECEQTAGPEAEIRLGQILPHGARLEVRLRRRSEETAVIELEFHAYTLKAAP